MNWLNEIVEYKKAEVRNCKETYALSKLEAAKMFDRVPLKLTDYIRNPERSGIIAEFKRKSPSRGIINTHSGIEEVTTGYFRSGASGLSVLTDLQFFGGTLTDLKRARELNPIPILRKDFIIDKYQIAEAKAAGADVILLIAAILDIQTTYNLAAYAKSLQLEVLLEVHEQSELDHINEFIDIVGVNNRDLKTFRVETELSVELFSAIPSHLVKISESGISSPVIMKRLRSCGYDGFLIGESFMSTPDPAKAFSDFIQLVI